MPFLDSNGAKMQYEHIVFIILVLTVSRTNSINLEKEIECESFEFILWNYETVDIEEIQKLDYYELFEKCTPRFILTDKYIYKYYWDEQLIEFEDDKLKEETGDNLPISVGVFTIVLKGKVIYNGICRMIIPARKMKYDDSDYPAVRVLNSANSKNLILALTPRFYPLLYIFRDYPAEEQEKLLNKDIYYYFKEIGKLVEGKVNLREILADY